MDEPREGLQDGAEGVRRHLAALRRMDRALWGNESLERMLPQTMQALLEIFAVDRAWLLHPCDVSAEWCTAMVEATRPEYPGVFEAGEELAVTPEVVTMFHEVLDASGSVAHDPATGRGLPDGARAWGVRSQLLLALRPRRGGAWLLGLHQCSHARIWSAEEQRLFEEIGLRVGEALSTVLLVRDLERLQGASELAMRALEAERRLFLTGPVVVFKWRHEAGWPVEYVSPNVVETFGHPADDFLSARVSYADLVDPGDFERVAREVATAIDRGLSHFVHAPYRIRRADGRTIWIYDSTVPLRDDDGRVTHFLGYVIDITERFESQRRERELEQGMLHAQKLESLGVLAGGIAHDFNNLLTGILGHAHLCLLDLPEGAPTRAHIGQIETAARRAAELCSQMLAYSGKGRFEPKRIHLSALVEEIADMLRVAISKRVALRLELADDVPPIEADGTQLRQVVMNLITNAAEAYGDGGGEVRLGVEALDLGARDLARLQDAPALAPGRYVVLRVRDEGAGMEPETRERVFEPFFSTKFAGRGLGMAAVQGIVRGHGGAILIESEPGRGSTFTVVFPALAGGEERAAPEVRAAELRGEGTVLVVDDEKTVRDLARRMLLRHGFQVAEVEDGRRAVELVRAEPRRFVAVLLDMTMPHMSGEETFRRLRELNPDLPVVLSSGYDRTSIDLRFDEERALGFLHKPYRVGEFVQAMRAALGG